MVIRKAEQRDLQELLDIYNYEVENGVATWDIHPKTLAEREQWLAAHNVDNHPLIVADIGRAADSGHIEESGCAADTGRIAGYASLSPYREKEAYRSTVELSLYVAQQDRGRGVGTALMEAILKLAREDARTHMVVSVITAGNEASCRLHRKFGFTYCGTMRELGMKFGRYLDVEYYQLEV